MLPFNLHDPVKAGLNTREDNNRLEKGCFEAIIG